MTRLRASMMVLLGLCASMWVGGCDRPSSPIKKPAAEKAVEAGEKKESAGVEEGDDHTRARHHMVRTQIEARGVKDTRVLDAMRKVPRHALVADRYKPLAYSDRPLPIEARQTISQPYIVALMTELLELKDKARVLEVGTGSGYQAAVLAEMGMEVYSIEIVPELARSAKAAIDELGYSDRVQVREGDGYKGWPERAPFDGIVVTAAPDHIPQPLIDQLAVGGRMVIPVGEFNQDLRVLTRTKEGHLTKNVIPVRFVPMTGEAQEKKQ